MQKLRAEDGSRDVVLLPTSWAACSMKNRYSPKNGTEMSKDTRKHPVALFVTKPFVGQLELDSAEVCVAMAMVAFPVGSSFPCDLGVPTQAPQPGLIAMRAMPLGTQAQFPHLLGPASHEKILEDDYTSSGPASAEEHQEPERPALSSGRRRKPETRGLNLGKIPMAPGRVANPGMAWFNKTTCDQLQEQLQGSDDQISLASDALTGHVWDLSRHPLGCRLVQLALERSSQKQASQLAAELRGHVQEAMTSPHANYVPFFWKILSKFKCVKGGMLGMFE